jgi:Zn-dependent protease with chaperone function
MYPKFKALTAQVRYIVLSVLFILCSQLSVFSQSNIYTPIVQDVAQLQSEVKQYESAFQSRLKSLPSENRKDLEEAYNLRWKNIKEKFDKNEIYTSTEAQQYLNNLVAAIASKNPLLNDKKFTCFFSRTDNPNASYIGEGIIVFNMGLFYRLANEDQAAFVLCHELAHFYLRHSDNSIEKYVAQINSKEFQAGLRDVKNSQYGKRTKLEQMIQGLSFDSRRHTREHEHEADSMAVEFMKNTKFNVAESLTTLALLDSIDIVNLNTEACLQQTFNSGAYPFQNRWLRKEQGLLGGHAQLAEDKWADSLKTHPACAVRIAQLKPLVEKYHSQNTGVGVDVSLFRKLQNDFRYETVEFAFKSENYTRSLFLALKDFDRSKPDPFVVTMIGKNLNAIYHSLKSHQLGKTTDLPSPVYPANYNSLCQFIQNLYPENVAAISFNFLDQYKASMGQFAAFKAVLDDSSFAVKN